MMMPLGKSFVSPLFLALVITVFINSESRAETDAESEDFWQARGASTQVNFFPGFLEQAGLRVDSFNGGVQVGENSYLFVGPEDPTNGAALLLPATWGAFQGFAGGRLIHNGGFTVHRSDRGEQSSVAVGLVLEPGPRAPIGKKPRRWSRQLVIPDDDGDVLFVLDMVQPEVDAEHGRLSLLNMDLAIGDGLARRLGEPGLAGFVIGAVHSRAHFQIPEDLPARLAVLRKSCSSPNYDPDTTDVALIDIPQVQAGTRFAGRVAVVPGATLKNVGIADVPWFPAFSPENDHPILVWSLQRMVDSYLETVGISDAKHAFATANDNCTDHTCASIHDVLGQGCEDYYGVNTNTSTEYLAPRDEIEAFTVGYDDTGSHFDGTPLDGERSHGGSSSHAIHEHDLAADEDELTTPGARYFLEAWYLVRHDNNIWNSMGYREVLPHLVGNTWLFSFPLDSEFMEGPLIDGWVDPLANEEGASNTLVDTGQGRLKLAVRTTDLGAGRWRYDYALANFDLDPRVTAFSLLAAPLITEFAGAGDETGAWNAAVAGDRLTWTAASTADELDWGALYRFSLEAAGSPVASTVMLTTGSGASIEVMTLGPAGDIFTDGFESGSTSAWTAVFGL